MIPAASGMSGIVTPAERETLRLVDLLPLASAATIALLSGLREVDSANRLLAALEHRGFAAFASPPAERGRSARLWYPTSEGRALLLADSCHGPEVRCAGSLQLRRLLAALPLVEALHQLIGAIAAAPGLVGVAATAARPTLLDWRQPWRGIYYPARSASGRAASVALHGAAEIAWGDRASARILVQADLGTLPFAAWATLLAGLMDYRDARRSSPRAYHNPALDPLPPPPPLIVIAEDAGRRDEWLRAIRAGAHDRGRRPEDYAIDVHTRAALDARVTGANSAALPSVRRASSTGREPVHACETNLAARGAGRWRGERAGWPDALVLRPREWRCLEILARHPFLTGADLATLLGSPLNNVEADRARLARRGLLEFLQPAPSRGRPPTRGQLAELTVRGLRARARWEGLTLGQAVRWSGFVGGGTRSPIGDRARLARNLDHTRGVASVIVSLYRAANRPVAARAGARVLLWENAAACAAGSVQPDARVRMAWGGAMYEALLEYDRGTEWRERWLTKARAWANALIGSLSRARVPVIWVVTEGDAAERRIARLLSEAGHAWNCPLPVLVTTTARLMADPDGPLGAVWRGLADESDDERLYWLPPVEDGAE